MKKIFAVSVILLLVATGWRVEVDFKPTSTFGQEIQAPRGELRVVDKDVSNWAWIASNVFEHFIEVNKDGKLMPGLATSWQ